MKSGWDVRCGVPAVLNNADSDIPDPCRWPQVTLPSALTGMPDRSADPEIAAIQEELEDLSKRLQVEHSLPFGDNFNL